MDLSQVAKMQEDARAMGRAAQYLGRAANELAPVALPAAREAIARTPGRLATIAGRVRDLTPEKLRQKQTAAAIVAGVCAAGFAAAIAHVVHHRKVAAEYREQKRAAEEARQQRADRERVLGEAAFACTAAEFLERAQGAAAGAAGADGDGAGMELDAPGCFAIAAYDADPEQGDYAAYRDVYVGASKDAGAAARRQLEGRGNLYVHADVVYGQPLRVFFFPCEGYEVYARKEGLVRALGADSSYNKITEIADLD